jgi:hypothetical protein
MLTTFRLEIDRLLRAGVSLEEIDRRLIATAPVEPDRRDALWLYGWLRSEGRAPAAARAISSAQGTAAR